MFCDSRQPRWRRKPGSNAAPRKIADAAETRLFALAASLVPSGRRLVRERDRRFESSSLQGRVVCEPACWRADDPPPRGRRRHRGRNWLPHVPRHGDYRLPLERRRARACAGNGGAREPAQSMTGANPAPFMLANMEVPTAAERI